MKSIKENYREFEIGRFLYEVGGGPGANTAESAEAAQENTQEGAKQEEAVKPLEDHDFEGHAQKYKNKLTELKQAYQGSEDTPNTSEIENTFSSLEDSYDAQMQSFRSQYGENLEDITDAHQETIQTIGKSLTPQVQGLITEIERHLATAPEQPAKPAETTPATGEAAKPSAPEGTEAAPESLDTIEAKVAKFNELIKTNPILFQAISAYFPNLKLEGKTTPEQYIADEGVQKFVTNLMEGLSEEGIAKLAKGEVNISQEATKKALLSAIGVEGGNREAMGKDEKEINLIKKLKLTVGDQEKSFDEVFGENSPIPELISRTHVITKEGGVIKAGDTEITDISGLKDLLPPGYQDDFDTLTGDNSEKKEQLNASVGKLNELYEAVRTNVEIPGLTEMMAQIEATPDKKNPIEGIAAFLGLITAFMNALKSGDMTTLTEMLEDFGESKDPLKMGEGLKRSKEAYTKFFEGETAGTSKDNLYLLAKAYTEPTGDAADALFGKKEKGNPLSRHRIESQGPIMKHIREKLGINITKIEPGTGAVNIEGNATVNSVSKKIRIAVSSDASNNPQIQITQLPTGEETKETSLTRFVPIASLANALSIIQNPSSVTPTTPTVATAPVAAAPTATPATAPAPAVAPAATATPAAAAPAAADV